MSFWKRRTANIGDHEHLSTQVLDPDDGQPIDLSDQSTAIAEALEEIEFTQTIVQNIVNETFITEITQNNTFIEEIVNQITLVEEDNEYITQIVENNTYISHFNVTISGKKGVANELASLDGSGFVPLAQIRPSLKTSSIQFLISDTATGIKGRVEVPFACTITAVRMFADVSGSAVVDIWKDSYANYPPTDADSITASAPPTLSSAIKSQDTTLTGWTTALAAGDVLIFNLDSASTLTALTVSLTVAKA